MREDANRTGRQGSAEPDRGGRLHPREPEDATEDGPRETAALPEGRPRMAVPPARARAYGVTAWSTLCIEESETTMDTAKDEVRSLLDRLPDDCTLEDVQYHLYVVEKVQRGIERAEEEGGGISHEEVERRLGKWLSE